MPEGTELGKAYVQIVPSAKGIKGAVTKQLGGESKDAGEKSGLRIASFMKKAIIGAGIGVALKKTLDIGGDLQQSYLGGLDTLYGDAADAARKYADQAASAGISMNSWSEQAVSFGAVLKKTYGSDAAGAADAANRAIMAMADNSAKMGTDIGSIQAAYQGFAKDNYTMLDNLKLGYGGTKTEMERLLKDASAMTKEQEKLGVTVDANDMSFANVANAIQVVQENLGLAGVASQEASETFTGSMGAMKAAAENFMGNLMLGQNVEESMVALVDSTSTFLFKNLIPAVGTVFKSLPAAAGAFIRSGLPSLVSSGQELVTGLINGAQEKVPELISKAGDFVTKLGEGVSSKGPELLAKGGEIVVNLANGVWENIPSLLQRGSEMVSKFVSYVGDNLPKFAEKGGEILKNLATGFVNNFPSMVVAVGKFGVNLLENILKLGGSLLDAGGKLIGDLASGLGGSALSLVSTAASKVKETLLKPIEAGKEKIKDIIEKIKGFFSFKIRFPHIPLPHFSISPSGWKIGDLLKGSIPSLGITWNKQAMDSPRIFSKATLFGAGEAGDEVLYGRKNLMRDIREASGGHTTNNYFNFTVNGAEDPELYADRLVRRLKMDMRTE